MSKLSEENIIYKADVSVWFYINNTLIAFVPVVMLLMKLNYLIIIGSIILVLIWWGNMNNFIIEVYPEYFKLILPTFPVNLSKNERVFYFENMKDYSFEKGANKWSSLALG